MNINAHDKNKKCYSIWIGIVSLFPEMFFAITDYGITSQAIKNNMLKLNFWNPKDYTHNQNGRVDERPYGGGPGMLMKAQPIQNAIYQARKKAGKAVKVIYLSPQGRKLDQKGVNEFANNSKIILVCGRYEGIDERVIKMEVDEEWSIGDYVLSGGELAAMTIIDATSRLIPGVLGHSSSVKEDSFSSGLLDYPHYTRPKSISGTEVPPVLLSGNHEKIRIWRLKQSLGRTWLRRPDLLEQLSKTDEQKILLAEFQNEYKFQ